jgi:ABC-type proline/glycine betaine transport system permease subunit
MRVDGVVDVGHRVAYRRRRLGTEILNAISTSNAGQGLVAGLGVFILAVLLDRVTKGVAGRFALRAARCSATG